MTKNRILFLALLVLLFGACSKKLESCFTYTTAGAAVTFSSSCSENATGFTWDFGDGSTATQPNPVHSYAATGIYEVTLVVKDAKGKKSSQSSQSVSVTVPTVVTCNPACANGACVNGNCVCDPGYEGVDCGTRYNAKFSGTYTLTETCSPTGPDSYAVILTPSATDPTKVTFSGLYREPQGIEAVIGSDGVSFTIARQVNNLSGFELECTNGSSNAAGTTITLTYRMYQYGTSTVIETCTGVLTK